METNIVQLNNRNYSIDIVKCLAAIIITNSHFELLYGNYSFMATGGTFGDALFFFCSGYTLFLGRQYPFFTFYKRRINRIYPTIFAWAFLNCLFFNSSQNFLNILLFGGGWFVSCIMIYYIILWFIKKYALKKIPYVILVTFFIVVLWYFCIGIESNAHGSMYGRTYFKWCHFFIFMLLGALMGYRSSQNSPPKNYNILLLVVVVLFSIFLFYVFFYFHKRLDYLNALQLFSLLPLSSFCYFLYHLFDSPIFSKIFHNKILGGFIRFVGGLCLEIYIVQFSLITDRMNAIFPLNIIIMFAIILIFAYCLKCLSRLWIQIFSDKDFDIKYLIKAF